MALSRIGGIAGLGLLFISILALAVIIERTRYWWFTIKNRKRIFDIAFQNIFLNQEPLKINRIENEHIIIHLFGSLDLQNQVDLNHHKDQLDHSFETVKVELQKYDSVLTTIISISPLIGLLGTVLGLIRSLQGLTLTDLAESNLSVMAGISEALISTAAGLTIAVISLVALNIFRGLRRNELRKLRSFIEIIEERLAQLQY